MNLPPPFTARSATRHRRRSNLATFISLIAVFAGIIAADAVLFQGFMQFEGRSYSWLTGLYWAVQTMSTLGYGHVVFESDAGRLFSPLVLLTGIAILFTSCPPP